MRRESPLLANAAAFSQDLRLWGRILGFRASEADFASLAPRHLAMGLVAAALAGAGRTWDVAGAPLVQHLGVGSVLYVFVLAALLWLVVAPLAPANFSYLRLATFVSLTSPLAFLYAIPVERFLSLDAARAANAGFLGAVATWRVLLLAFWLRRNARFSVLRTAVATLLPITLIVTALFLLNLDRAAFELMSGIRDDGTPRDLAYRILAVLTGASAIAFVPLAAFWVVLVVFERFGGRE